jgi:nucleoid DNA-binding protein
MDPDKAFLVICITLIVVVGINAAIYATVTRRKQNTVGQFELMRRATKRGRNPWGDENAKLEELSKTVASLKEKQDLDEEDNAR